MNENIDLTKILKGCPIDFKLYSPMCGIVLFRRIDEDAYAAYPIKGEGPNGNLVSFTQEGRCFENCPGAECLLFPSKDQRDWSKFTAPWYKKDKFDPKTLKAFDKVLTRNEYDEWTCALFSHIDNKPDAHFKYITCDSVYKYCIPYNDETKHLIGTKDKAPKYYKYWEE